MIEKDQKYRCNICGNMVEIVEVGGGQLMCCMAPMELIDNENEE
ncbi:desulfoferrodoxin FeS4 iron-binding domain-containing protein [Patescibacteria group bacterium]